MWVFTGWGNLWKGYGVSFLDSFKNLSEADKKFNIIKMIYWDEEDLDTWNRIEVVRECEDFYMRNS